MNAIYFLYYPAWPDKNELALSTVFPELNDDDSGSLSAFLFTEVDGMIYTDIKTCLENVLNHVTEDESYTGNAYHLQMDAEFTSIFDLYAYEDDDDYDDSDDDDDWDDDDLDDEDDDFENARELKLVLEINSSQLLRAMMDYRQKKDDFAKGWRPDIIIDADPNEITTEMVMSKI